MKNIAFFLMIIVLAGCARTTYVTSSWVKPGTEPVVPHNILVVALVDKNRSYLQKVVEHDVVAGIREKGYNAISYYDLYGAANMGKPDEQALVNNLRNNGDNTILTITLLDTTMREKFISSDASYEPYDQFNHRFIGYFEAPYWPSYARRYAPGYYQTDTRYYWETNLYTANSQDLVYSALTASLDPGSSNELAQQYSHAAVKDMQDNAILLKPKFKRHTQSSRQSVALNN